MCLHYNIANILFCYLATKNQKFETSPTKLEYVKYYYKNMISKSLNFGDSVDLPDEASDEEECVDEVQNNSEVRFTKRKITEKDYGKYDSISKDEIYGINNYCKDSLWRRAKFINDKQLGDEFNIVCKRLDIEPENRNHKYVDICLLIQNNMNYRRSYSTKRMRELMVCTSICWIVQLYFNLI